MKGFLYELHEDVKEWCRGRLWLPRALFLLWFAYMLTQFWASSLYSGIFGGINLAIHEWGHVVFGSFGKFIAVAGGTILQCLAPVAAFVVFFKQRDYFAMAFTFGWMSTNLFGVATYMADARARKLPLVSIGYSDNITHDWTYMLNKMGVLALDTTLAFMTRVAASLSMFIFLGVGAYLCWLMHSLDPKKTRGLPGID